MRRSITALAFCLCLLGALSLFLFPPTHAKDNVLLSLLDLPAPPPPNPLEPGRSRFRYRRQGSGTKEAPKDNAPIDELMEYWRHQNEMNVRLGYNPKPSDASLERIIKEIEKDPKLLTKYLHMMEGSERSVDVVKDIYDREGTTGAFDRSDRRTIKGWLTYNSSYFSNDLAQMARQAGDEGEYVSHQDELLALARFDFDKARPIIDSLYANGSQKASQVLAKWALYTHALATDSTGDIERYRDELKAVVEDKGATPGMRDLAMDALVKEKEWPGREDWYYSLLGDETLAELKVNGSVYTGLTTILYYAPEERYLPKMLEMLKSDNKTVRTAVIKNLLLLLGRKRDPEIVRALLPWLEDPKWATDVGNTRSTLVAALAEIEMPESVPGLIKVIDEKAKRSDAVRYGTNTAAANMPSNMLRYSSNTSAANKGYAANSYNGYAGSDGDQTYYPYRIEAVRAFGMQKDVRAAPVLRRVLGEVQGYERDGVVKAMIACHGFSVAEEVDALESAAKGVLTRPAVNAYPVGNAPSEFIAPGDYYYADNMNTAPHPFGPADVKQILGRQLMQAGEVTDDLAQAVAARIEILDGKEPPVAKMLRNVMLRWHGNAVDIMLLRDLKNGRSETAAITRLLSDRKELSERLPTEVSEAKTGTPAGAGIAGCITGDPDELATMLASENTDTKTAVLACSRLIRASLPVARVAELTRSTDKTLALAAERYLESDDSPQARAVVLGLHPNDARILGARSCFQTGGAQQYYPGGFIVKLFAAVANIEYQPYQEYMSVCDQNGDLDKIEKRAGDEVKADGNLLGEYAYDGSYVKIYKDKVLFSWDDDDSRYHERPLTAEEFDGLKQYLANNRVDELAPFLDCQGECQTGELVMVSRAGGRRVYYKTDNKPDFFAGLTKYFDDLKLQPSTLKYGLSREIPGLEIVLADADLHVETVWKNGDDLRVLVSSRAARKKVETEIETASDDEMDNASADNKSDDYNRAYDLKVKMRKQREYEGYAWHKVAGNALGEFTSQPPGVEYLTPHDGAAVPPSDQQWKARAGDLEVRADDKGIYKYKGGKLAKIQDGSFSDVVVTPNGQWAVATRVVEEDYGFVRLNLVTNKMFPVEFEHYPRLAAFAYIPTINRVLLMPGAYAGEGEGEGDADGPPNRPDDDRVTDDPTPESLMLLDPATGAVQGAPGEYRPLTQQTFRPLQATSKPNEFWAAMPDTEKNETLVGVYDTNHFGFRQVLKIPKITFDSMRMWVDEAGGKIYFVYRGHLLSLPLGKTN